MSGGQISFDEEPKVLRYSQNDLNMMIAGMFTIHFRIKN